MARFKAPCATLALALIAPIPSQAANFCIAVGGGFGKGGTSFIAPSFTVPAKNACAAWSGFTKTGSTVVGIANGTGCMSSNGKVLQFSIFNTDPSFFGANTAVSDQIVLCPTGTSSCPVTGEDTGYFSGGAAQQTCSTSLLTLPQSHD
jgi:hypothetical protein